MTSDPDQIRQSIEETRASLSADVDTLNEKVNPARVVQRQKSRAGAKLTGAKDKVMGTASDSSSSVAGAMGSAQDRATSAVSSVTDTAAAAPDAIRQRTEGNPLAAGLVAFGVGWLASSLVPSSSVEQKAGTEIKERGSDLAQSVASEAKQVAQDVAQDLKGPAQEAADSVKSTAQGAAQEVKSQAQSAKDDVTSQAQDSKQNVQGQSSSTTY